MELQWTKNAGKTIKKHQIWTHVCNSVTTDSLKVKCAAAKVTMKPADSGGNVLLTLHFSPWNEK